MLTISAPITSIIRFLMPVVAVLIVLEIVFILLRNRKKPEPMAFFRQQGTTEDIEILFYENAIGRSKVNDIVLLDPSASRFHAVLSLREAGWFITDTESRSGVYVNDVKVERRARLQQGDRLRLGNTTILFRERARQQQSRRQR